MTTGGGDVVRPALLELRCLEEADSSLCTAWELALMALTTLELIYSDAVQKGMYYSVP